MILIRYNLGSLSCFWSNNNSSVCADCFCDVNISCIFALHLAFVIVWIGMEPNYHIGMGEHYLFVNHFMEKVNLCCICLVCIPLNYFFKCGTFISLKER